MDYLISSANIRSIAERINDVDKNQQYTSFEQDIETLFDGEEVLYESSTDIINSFMNEIDDPRMPAEIKINVAKNLWKCVVLGFLCERYSRDIILDERVKGNNLDIKREYESVESYIRRKWQPKTLENKATENKHTQEGTSSERTTK